MKISVCLECGLTVQGDTCPKCGKKIQVEDIGQPPIKENNKEV